jgi:hypothetical protein
MLIIPASWEAETGGSWFRTSPGKSTKTLSEKQTERSKRAWGYGSSGESRIVQTPEAPKTNKQTNSLVRSITCSAGSFQPPQTCVKQVPHWRVRPGSEEQPQWSGKVSWRRRLGFPLQLLSLEQRWCVSISLPCPHCSYLWNALSSHLELQLRKLSSRKLSLIAGASLSPLGYHLSISAGGGGNS